MADVDVSVVVASHARPRRLLWLLNALEEQTFPAHSWDVVVAHDYDAATAARILDDHPLASAGRLRREAIAPGTGSPARQRNIGWRATRAPLLAFVDDDCRPAPDWLESLVAVAALRPGAFVQGATRPDPFERDLFAAPHVRTLRSEPPNRSAQTCNILYPREVLERVGGFDERLATGEDMDLAVRARHAGALHAAAPRAVVFHCVEALTVVGAARDELKWRHLALVVKRHREVRRACVLGVFWDGRHLNATLALAGLAAARRRPRAAALALPWLVQESGRRGRRPAELAVNAAELPGRLVVDAARLGAFAAGSWRHRTLVL
jgi:GT2 family glycosyltransferase